MTISLKFLASGFLALTLVACSSSSPAPVTIGGQQVDNDFESGPEPQRADDDNSEIIPADAERLYPNEFLYLCSGIRVSNAPDHSQTRRISTYSRLVVVDGKVPIVIAPANNACVSSGFGMRTLKGKTRMHKGLDITSRPASRVFSAGAGTILEAGFNGGYGLSILIDHGDGVYTRYAHLNHVEDNIEVGNRVYYGMPIGLMGKSGHVTGIHLHFEILTGTYQPGVWGRGLKPRDPFSFPAWLDDRIASNRKNDLG